MCTAEIPVALEQTHKQVHRRLTRMLFDQIQIRDRLRSKSGRDSQTNFSNRPFVPVFPFSWDFKLNDSGFMMRLAPFREVSQRDFERWVLFEYSIIND